MIESVWSGWEAGETSSDDRFDTQGTTACVSLLLRGGVDVTWTSGRRRRAAFFSEGMSKYRPPDGHEHTYRRRWRAGGLLFSVNIPVGQFALVMADEDMQAPADHRHLFGVHDPFVEQCMRRLHACRTGGLEIPDAVPYGRRLLVRILELQGASSPRWGGTTSPLPRHTLDRLRDFVDDRLSGPVAALEMADIAGLSLGHFARRLRLTLGVSPGAFILTRRVRAVFARVTTGDMPLADIARSAGFSSQSTMNRAFARATGFTPGYARRRRLRVPAAFALRQP